MSGTMDWLQRSEQDSRRFDIRIVRGALPEQASNARNLADEVASFDAELAIVRCPAGDTTLPAELLARGLVPVHADTLVYYAREARLPVRQISPDPDLRITSASEADRLELSTLATKVFANYKSHYHANPELDPAAIAAGYGEWAVSCLVDSTDQGDSDRQTWVVRKGDSIVAFATCRLDEGANATEILLNAVDPGHMRQGIYGSLLRHILGIHQQQGWATVRISTQVWNYVVQRAWSREGFLLTHAFDTYHVKLHSQQPRP